MKILLSTLFLTSRFSVLQDHYFNWFIKHMPHYKCEVYILLLERYYNEHKNYCLKNNVTPILMTNKDVEYIFEKKLGYVDIFKKVQLREVDEKTKARFKEVILSKFPNWIPDMIVSQGFYSVRKLYNYAYPSSIVFSNENSIFSRFPFERALNYDLFDVVPNSFLTTYAKEINNYKITEKQNREVEDFKKELTRIIDSHSPYDKIIKAYRKKYKHLLLLPLIGDYFNALLEDSYFEKDSEIIEYVMKNTPQNIGIIVTGHDSAKSTSEEKIYELQKKYPNLIRLPQQHKSKYYSSSLYCYQYVDAVFNLYSKTGYTALLWDKPIISLSKVFNNLIKDGDGVEDIEKVLTNPLRDKNHIIYWYFTHYLLLMPNIKNSESMYDFFENKIKKYKEKGITFDIYEQINDLKLIGSYICSQVRAAYKEQTEISKIKRFANFIRIVNL